MLYKKRILVNRKIVYYEVSDVKLRLLRCLGKYGCFRCKFLKLDGYGEKVCTIGSELGVVGDWIFYEICRKKRFNYYFKDGDTQEIHKT